MPLKKARGKSDASIQKAVGKNMAILYSENKNKPEDEKRGRKQIQYIAFLAATGKLKKPK